jgi:N-acetylglutamate synthase-like GNAT family acetyltransferase
MPRWLAFEERFIVAERDGRMVGVLRFRRDPRGLYLGLLVTDPLTDEDPLAEYLYAGARAVARELGVGEIRARTRRHEAHLARAGYRKGRDLWRLDLRR